MKFSRLWRKTTETEAIEHLENKQETSDTKSAHTIFEPQEKEKTNRSNCFPITSAETEI